MSASKQMSKLDLGTSDSCMLYGAHLHHLWPTYKSRPSNVWAATCMHIQLPCRVCTDVPANMLPDSAGPLARHSHCRFNFNLNDGPISIEWFKGAVTNVCYNALDRHVKAGNGDRVAIYWEGNDEGVQSKTTYKELLDMTCQ